MRSLREIPGDGDNFEFVGLLKASSPPPQIGPREGHYSNAVAPDTPIQETARGSRAGGLSRPAQLSPGEAHAAILAGFAVNEIKEGQ